MFSFFIRVVKAAASMLHSPKKLAARSWLAECFMRTLRSFFVESQHNGLPWLRSQLDAISLNNPYFSKVSFAQTTIAQVPCLMATPKSSLETQSQIGADPENNDSNEAAISQTVIVYLHGGGYVSGSARSYKGIIAALAHEANSLVIAPDYCLAPEHPFPGAQNECLAVTLACLEKYQGGMYKRKLIIVGDSAGGALAVNTARQLCQRPMTNSANQTHQVDALVLLSPWVDPLASTGSMVSNAENDFLTASYVHKSFQATIQKADQYDSRINLTKSDLSMLPPTLIQCGTGELFFDQIQTFARTLKHQGVNVSLENFEDQFHVFQLFTPILKPAKDAVNAIAGFISSV